LSTALCSLLFTASVCALRLARTPLNFTSLVSVYLQFGAIPPFITVFSPAFCMQSILVPFWNLNNQTRAQSVHTRLHNQRLSSPHLEIRLFLRLKTSSLFGHLFADLDHPFDHNQLYSTRGFVFGPSRARLITYHFKPNNSSFKCINFYGI